MTTLLEEIQAAAADDSVSVTTLLRKCQILAGRLRNESLRTWVRNELEGYPPNAELPAYRQPVRGRIIGTVANIARWYQNAPLAETSIPEEFRESFMTMDLRQPASELEHLARSDNDPSRPLPPELWGLMEQELGGGYQILQAGVHFSRVALVGVIDSIRTRALEFAIEIEAANPTAGEPASTGAPAIAQDVVERAVSTTIYAENVNVAQGSTGVQQTVTSGVKPGDLEALIRALTRAGVTADEITGLRAALEADEAAAIKPGPRTADWIGRVTVRLASASSTVGLGAAAQVVGVAVARYLGLM